MICVFDIETIPDADLIRDTLHLEGEDIDVSLSAMDEQEAKSGSSFLPLPYHKIITISAVIADDYGTFKKVSSIEGANEKEMIKNFLVFIDRQNPKLISFNGRSFDMPLLMIRAMKYSLSCPAYFEVDNNMLNKNKWDNYRYRFSNRFHIDLMDHISEFGAARGLKLDVLCTMIGAPGKYDVKGDQVMELYYADELEKIQEYCESDVLNTYWLFLKYELLKGNVTIEDFKRSLAIMGTKLNADKSYTEVFNASIQRELEGE
ncbi:3'-5' exonuclease [Sulfurospirillum sp. 1612]|uniref:3'-5' exonuclease n=1 Tax=Sulfurospirillum sp. 1612 TaxID=3094835 RepID=UPI002F943282